MAEHLPDWQHEFSLPSLEEWKAQLVKTLKGRTAEELHWLPEPGINVAAYYSTSKEEVPEGWENSRPGSFPFLRGSGLARPGDGWQLIQEINLNEASAKRRIKEARQAGIQAFRLVGKTASVDIWNQLHMEQIAIHLAVDAAPILSTTDLKMALSLQKAKPDILTGSLQYDPISDAAAKGKVIGDAAWIACEGGISHMADSPHFRTLGVDLSYVRELGGATSHELAFALGTIVEYLDHLSRMGHEIEELLANLSVTFSTSNRFFLELAKFRAFRLLYANMVSAYQVDNSALHPPFLMARSTGRETAEDMPNHLIQLTTQSISAILGGVDGMLAEAGEHEDAARWARNIQHLLRHESHLHLVQDPAGGAHYMEILTHQLASEAWELFQKMEATGGFLANIRNGRVPGLMEAFRRLEEERSAKA
ncbi:MAG: methylmalonyl-CoA mutase family protein [Bacteroidota bacterium]